jgi:hypothetical protein
LSRGERGREVNGREAVVPEVNLREIGIEVNSSPPLRYSKLLAARKIRLSYLAKTGLRDSRGDFYSRTLVYGLEML